MASARFSAAPIDVVQDLTVTDSAGDGAGLSVLAGTTVRLQSSVGATLSGGGAHRILYVGGGAVLYLDGLTLADGKYTGGACTSPYGSGSAVYVAAGGQLRARNSRFVRNAAGSVCGSLKGGALFVGTGGYVRAEVCQRRLSNVAAAGRALSPHVNLPTPFLPFTLRHTRHRLAVAVRHLRNNNPSCRPLNV
eukprot:7378648-Prymnesium_polylepis.3